MRVPQPLPPVIFLHFRAMTGPPSSAPPKSEEEITIIRDLHLNHVRFEILHLDIIPYYY